MKKMSAYALTGALALMIAFATGTVVNPQPASAKVKVKKVTVVAPSGKTAYVAKGKKVKLSSTVKVTPNKKVNKKVICKSANKKIATVTSKGVVKAKAVGKTKITVVSKKIFNANKTKNFVLPLYRVTVATNIPGAVAYSEYPDINLVDNYGKIYPVFDHNGSMDGDFSMYAYLEPGTYSVDEYNTNTVYAYGKVDSYTDTYGRTVYERTNSLGNYKVSGSFNVTGNGTVTLNAVKKKEDE